MVHFSTIISRDIQIKVIKGFLFALETKHNFTIIDTIKYKTITAKFYLLHILTTFKTLVTKKIKKLIVIKFTILTTYRDSDMINSDKIILYLFL